MEGGSNCGVPVESGGGGADLPGGGTGTGGAFTVRTCLTYAHKFSFTLAFSPHRMHFDADLAGLTAFHY